MATATETGRRSGRKAPKAPPTHRRYAEAKAETIARRTALLRDVDPGEALQEVLDSLTEDLRYAQEQVDNLDPASIWLPVRPTPDRIGDADYSQGVVLNAWVRYRDSLRAEIARVSNEMARTGLAERAVRLKEQEAGLIISFMEAVALELDLSAEQRRALGPALRTHRPLLEGTAHEVG